MPATIFGNPAVAIGLYQAFYGKAPANATYVNNVALAAQNGPSALAAAIGANFATTPAADLAKTVLANLGISNATLETALDQIFTAYPAGARGQIVLNLTNLLSGLEGDATFGAAAKAYNVTVAANNAYSSNVANTTDSVPGTTTGNEAGKSTVLTVGQDVLTGTAVADFFRGVAGVQVGSQAQTTLNSSDIIDGAAGNDTLIVNLVNGGAAANYGGGARIKNIETLQLGTNIAASTFDYNVNQGANEITDVTTIVADQINQTNVVNEDLTIDNILKTGNDLPLIHWKNEAGSVAGEVDVNDRASAVAGATTQGIKLENVAANIVAASSGVLNVAAGVETFEIESAGAGNTLNNHETQQTANAAGTFVDLASGTGSLTKVVVKGSASFGKTANVIDTVTDANHGQTNRAVGSDLGNNVATATARADSSNLVSLAHSVLEYDASQATGAQAVRFTPNATASTGANVIFKGGSAADYAEFELGNINANGGAGDDTFAFVNGLANSTFGESDSMNGGDGSDTIQIGLNGANTFNISETELRNKTSFGTIDLRGATNNLTLSSDFVAAADTANSITVRTDKIIQVSDTSTANTAANAGGTGNGLEDASTNTINLTKLGSTQSVLFEGGSGSDRIILNDATFNVLKTLKGGDLSATTVYGAGQTRYDTITVVTNGENVVVDAADLSNVSGFEGFVLTKNSAQATYNITLTTAFLTNNTTAVDDATRTAVYNDTVFQIGTRAAANNAVLGAGDTVTIDITDLYTAGNVYRGGVRSIDTASLENAGVAVQYLFNNTLYTSRAALQAAVPALTDATLWGGRAVGTATADANDVLGSGANAAAAAAGVTFASGIGPQNVLGTNNNDTFTLSQQDTVAGGTGADTVTFNAGSGGARVTLGAGADTVNLNAEITSATGFLQMNGGGTLNVNAAVANMNANAADYALGAGTTVEVNVAQVGMTLENSALTVNSNAGGTFTLGAAAQTFNGVGNFVDSVTTAATAAAQTVNTAAGNDIVNVVVGTTGTVAINAGAGDDIVRIASVNGATYTVALGDGADTLRVDNAAIVVADVNTVTVSDFNLGTDVFQSWVAGATIVAGAYVTANAAVANKITGQVAGNVIEILSTGVDGVQIANPTNDASVLASLNQVLVGGGVVGDIANGNYTVIGYQGANAYVYQIAIAGGDGTGGGNDLVELVGVLSNVGADAINAINIA